MMSMANLIAVLCMAAFRGVDASGLPASTQIALAEQSTGALSPVTRVVELLQGMAVRIEADGKAEEDLYERFVCWANSMTSQKEGTNAAAQSRIDYLTTYISDLSSGRIELTSERTDLEKEIETLTKDLEVASQMRTKEVGDFRDASTEMNQAITALQNAIAVLSTATQGHESGVLLSVKASAQEGEGFEARKQQSASLLRAVSIGSNVLSQGDASFLRRVLTGDVPQRTSWNKLNRKATFKHAYKARSFKIQAALQKLLEKFQNDFQEAQLKDQKAAEVYQALTQAKGDQKSAAETALSKLEKEMGAAQLSLAEANSEKSKLATQISNDDEYNDQVKHTLSAKKEEWKKRQVLRTGELAAISKAIQILHNDGARDLLKRSFKSQEFMFSFLQEGEDRAARKIGTRRQEGTAVLRTAVRQTHDKRLASLVGLATSGHFDDVLAAIDNMTQVLKDEEAEDLRIKEDCEKDRAADTRAAATKSRHMDELTDGLTAQRQKIAETTAEIEEKEGQIVAINQELNESADQRSRDHAEYLVAKQDDEEAAATISRARDVLAQFYKDNNLMLSQTRSVASAPFTSQAGDAPPPPPKTWSVPGYEGKTDEADGILMILDTIKEDVEKDIETANENEAASLALYQKTKGNLEPERTELTTAIGDLTSVRSAAEQLVQQHSTDRNNLKEELKIVLGRISDAEPTCDFFAINFQRRSKNRQLELDSLQQAKAILSGAVFDNNADEDSADAAALVQDRTPGQRPKAFLQLRRHV